jgi:ferric-dicitrate binding protein FerR (iron transport regulator)
MPTKRILLYIWISLLLIVAIFFLIRDSQPSSRLTETMKLSGDARIILYDGAEVTSNETGADQIILSVAGKCFVEVAATSSSQLVIYTDEALIKISAGAAVIDASKEHTTTVIVAEGAVSLTSNPEKSQNRIRLVELAPGEKGILSPNARGVVKQNNRDKNFMSWVDFAFTFDNTRLVDALSQIEVSYGVVVTVNVPNHRRCKLTGVYEGLSIEELLTTLAEEFGLELMENDEGQWELNGEGC